MNCIVCGYDIIRKVDSYQQWELMHCSNCDLMFWHPLVFNENQYREDMRYVEHAWKEIVNPYHKDALNIIRRHISFLRKTAIILEVGCGNGSFMKLLSKEGIDAVMYGIDLNCGAINVAKLYFGDNVGCVNLFEQSSFTTRKYDIVCFFEVLEHQTELCRFIETVKQLLFNGGVIVGTVPNRYRYLPLKRELVDYPPHHFTWWSKYALQNYLDRSGFTDIEVFECNQWNFIDFSLSVENVFIRSLKNCIKQKAFKEGTPKTGLPRKLPLVYRLANSRPSRLLRTLLTLPLSLPLYMDYLRKGAPGRTLLFKARRC